MSFGRSLPVSSLAVAAAGFLLSGCIGGPGVERRAEQALLPEAGILSGAQLTPADLAARPEPKSVAEVAAIEAELALIAEQRSAGASAREVAAAEARARALQRLVAAEQAVPLRR